MSHLREEKKMDIMKLLHEDRNIAFAIATMLGIEEYPEAETVMAVHNLSKKDSKLAIKLAKEYNDK